MFKRHKIGFNLYGVLLFAVIMLPNIIWTIVPASNDILRAESVTPSMDIAASVFQVITIALIAVVVYNNYKSGKTAFIFAVIPAAAYYVCWIIYYCGVVTGALLIFMSVLPCLAFIVYAVLQKNFIAVLPALVFMILHIISTSINFL